MNALNTVLAGVFVFELYFALQSAGDRAALSSDKAALPVGIQGKGLENPALSTVSSWQRLILGRPLFDPSRRPPAAPSQASALPIEIPRLSGIMVTPTEKIAVFSFKSGDPVIVAENSHFGSFTVLSISNDSVTLKGSTGVIVLRSNFSYQGRSGKSVPAKTILPGGIDLSLINVPLPSAANWPGPPMIH